MNLTILTQYYPPEIGAPQARLSELATHFVQRGHSVTVLTAMPNYPTGRIYYGYGGLLRRREEAGVNVIRTFIYPTQKASFVLRMTNYLSFTLSSAGAGSILLHRTDYLMVESPPIFLGLSAAYLSRLKRARLIFNVSDLWPESAVRLGILQRSGLSFKASESLEGFCYRQAWLVTGQSKSILSNIKERFPECPTCHLSNGVDTRSFRPDIYAEHVRRKLGDKRRLVALYAGLHGLAQGLDQLLEAAELLQDDPKVQFVLIGDGPEKRALLRHADGRKLNNVLFMDPQPAKEMPAFLAAADIILVPLKMYIPGAVPSKLYEAMASGRAVVLIAEGEAADIVRQHEAGIVVKPGDIRGIVGAIRTLDSQSQLRRVLGENGRRAAEQYFDRTLIATRFVSQLEENL